jgi:hypothetical protein
MQLTFCMQGSPRRARPAPCALRMPPTHHAHRHARTCMHPFNLQGAYSRPGELWERAKGQDGTHEGWYKGAVEYWDKQEASYNGVLGGFGHVSSFDIGDSREMLRKVGPCSGLSRRARAAQGWGASSRSRGSPERARARLLLCVQAGGWLPGAARPKARSIEACCRGEWGPEGRQGARGGSCSGSASPMGPQP